MSTFTYTPSYEPTESSKPRVRKFQAGDGYENRIRFGLNTDPKEWGLVFSNRTNSERDNILAFLEARGGAESFDWTSPRGITGKYVCEDWQLTLSNYNNNQIRATFRQVFEQ
jgi:phage-related protein